MLKARIGKVSPITASFPGTSAIVAEIGPFKVIGGGGPLPDIGHGLKLETVGTRQVLSVDTVNDAEKDNTLPITSAAVYTEIGNIDAILRTI